MTVDKTEGGGKRARKAQKTFVGRRAGPPRSAVWCVDDCSRIRAGVSYRSGARAPGGRLRYATAGPCPRGRSPYCDEPYTPPKLRPGPPRPPPHAPPDDDAHGHTTATTRNGARRGQSRVTQSLKYRIPTVLQFTDGSPSHRTESQTRRECAPSYWDDP